MVPQFMWVKRSVILICSVFFTFLNSYGQEGLERANEEFAFVDNLQKTSERRNVQKTENEFTSVSDNSYSSASKQQEAFLLNELIGDSDSGNTRETVFTDTYNQVPDGEEYQALVALYNATGGDNWYNKTNWKNGYRSSDFATWFGVWVENGDVVRIALSSNNLNGTIPAEISKLKKLKSLAINQNRNLTGVIPKEIGSLTALEYLNLDFNNLTGGIPVELGNLLNLQKLWLQGNTSLGGGIPIALSKLTNLTGLYLGFLNLSGGIPAELSLLSNLQTLDLSGNNLGGSIPPQLGNLSKLTELLLPTCNLTGSIPAALGNLKNLKMLALYDNSLTGNIPPELGGLGLLETLRLGQNQLSGSIPESFGGLQSLKVFDLGINNLSGSIPDQLGGLQSLSVIWLYNNNFKGGIPNEWSSLRNLVRLLINGNSFDYLPNFSLNVNAKEIQALIQDNRFDFGDIEPNFTGKNVYVFSSLEKSPQAKIGTPQTVKASEGGLLELSILTGGSRNKYQWQKYNGTSWVSITGANAATFKVLNASKNDAGVYRCLVTNEWVTGLTLYTYDYTVEVLPNCNLNATYNIQQPTSGGDGQISVYTSGVAYPVQYTLVGNNINRTQATNVFDNLLTGDYTLTVKDASGCTVNHSIHVEPAMFVYDGHACPEETATLETYSNGKPVYWYSSPTTDVHFFVGQSYTTTELGHSVSFYVEADLGGFRTVRKEIKAIVKEKEDFSIFSSTDQLTYCAGDPINVMLSTTDYGSGEGGGEDGLPIIYNFVWQKDGVDIPGSENQQTIEVTEYGTYQVYYQSGNLCYWYTNQVAITSSGCVAPPTTTNATICSGETATLTATAEGSIRWYDNAIGGNLVGTGSNFTTPKYIYHNLKTPAEFTYYATATVDGLESERVPAVVTLHAKPDISSLSVIPASCQGATDGEIGLLINTSGNTTFSYELFKGNDVTPIYSGNNTAYLEFPNLGVGSYTIRVKDGNGCITNQTIVVPNGGPVVSVCAGSRKCGVTTGNVNLKVNVTVAREQTNTSYTYNILNATTNQVVHSGSGTFGTAHDISIAYDPASTYVFEYVSGGDFSCNVNRSTIVIPEAQLNVVLNEPSGHYYQCYVGQPIAVGMGARLSVTSCSTPSNAFTYTVFREGVLYRKESGEVIHGMMISDEGKYRLEVSNADYGCTASTTFTIQGSTITLNTKTKDESCVGASDGAASVFAGGGQAPYSYAWYTSLTATEPFSRLSKVEGLQPGTYYVEATDSKGCAKPARKAVEIKAAVPLGALSVTLPDGTSCGTSVTLQTGGGKAPFTFYWYKIETLQLTATLGSGQTEDRQVEKLVFTDNNPITTGTQSVSASNPELVLPGDYRVAVVDANGCRSAEDIRFNIPTSALPREYQLCFGWKTPVIEVTKQTEGTIVNQLAEMSARNTKDKLEEKTEECISRELGKIEANFGEYCLSTDALDDKVALSYNINQSHFTLYYYDRAGQLVKTVAPEQVKPLSGASLSRANTPAHSFYTTYEYNSLGQLVQQESPDGGITKFIYNKNGQLRFSQNAKQAAEGSFSYTKYDALSRILEVGEATLGTAYKLANGTSYATTSFEALKAIVALDEQNFQALAAEDRYPLAAHGTEEITKTVYSTPAPVTYKGQTQRYLQNRVSYTVLDEDGDWSTTADQAATYYSYDPHGNVEWMLQEVPGLGKKSLAYEYDLISGNVLQVKYNEGKADQFYHQYSYDADNRIEKVFTSFNGKVWEMDASYAYYKHGPLKRTELGEDKVQGVDYVYTIHNLLKAINDPSLQTANDPGKDGGNLVGRDVFGMILSYYQGDYSNAANTLATRELKPESKRNLYNGNIAAWTTNLYRQEGGAWTYDKPIGQQFTYDRLNRLKESKFSRYNNGSWTATQDYATAYTYDANGNILSLNRNAYGATPPMDRLKYHYVAGSNKLRLVEDAQRYADASLDPWKDAGDLKDQCKGCNTTTYENYEYDAIGNLVKDKAEGISKIEWTISGKVKTVHKTDGSHIEFAYDASGNRVKKTLQRADGKLSTTYYVRDASGNVMSVYKEEEAPIEGGKEFILKLAEQPVYGSDRLGMRVDGEQTLRKRHALNGLMPYTINENETYTAENSVWTLPVREGSSTALVQLDFSQATPTMQKLADLGETTIRQLSTVTDKEGNLQFTVLLAVELHGTENAVLLLDKGGHLIKGSENILAPAPGKIMGMPWPGKEGQYLLLSLGANGSWNYHTVNMQAAGFGTAEAPKGEVTASNQVFLSGTYVPAMAVLHDDRPETKRLYLYVVQKEAANSLRLQTYSVGETLEPLQTFESAAVAGNENLPVQLEISPNGHFLTWAVNKGAKEPVYGVAQGGAEIQIYQILVDSEARGLHLLQSTSHSGQLLVNSLAFGADSKTLYYSSAEVEGNVQSNRLYQLHALAENALPQAYAQSWANKLSLSRGLGGKVYVNEANSNSLAEVTTTGIVADALQAPENSFLTGVLLQGVHSLTAPEEEPVRYYTRLFGTKHYELKDHLGNVRATLGDKLLLVGTGQYEAQQPETYAFYYPFGMNMPGMNQEGTGYRYGFNGKEKDNEWNSGGAIYDYGFRIYDPRIAKFLSVDPLTSSYPWYTPYQFAGNKPIFAIDLDGLEEFAAEIHNRNTIARGLSKINKRTEAENYEAVRKADNEGRGKAGMIGVASVGIYYAGPPAILFIRNNWHHLLYNPVVHNEIAATVYGTVADDEWPLPAVGDNITKTTRYLFTKRNMVSKVGALLMEKGSKFANKSERAIVKQLLEEGTDVVVLAERRAADGMHPKTYDYLVGGIPTELKEISQVDTKDLKKFGDNVKKTIEGAAKQSEYNNIVLDVRKQEGATEAFMREQVQRARGNLKARGHEFGAVRVIGDGYDVKISD